MKRFFFYILGVLLLVVAADMAVGILAKGLLPRLNESSYYGEIDYAIMECDEDVVALGSSRAKSHFVPQLFMDSLGGTMFNAGSDGKNVIYYCTVGEEIVKRGATHRVVLDLLPNDLQRANFDRVSTLNPWYDVSDNISESVNLKSRFEGVKMISNLYRYNSTFVTLIYNAVRSTDGAKFLGYRRIDAVGENLIMKHYSDSSAVNHIVVDRLVNFILLCKSHNVDLSIVISPLYMDVDPNMPSLIKIAELCSEYEVPFYNYSDMFLAHPEYFKDDMHMNHTGASLFTERFIHDALMK